MSRIDYDLGKIRGVVFDVDGVLSPSTVPLGPDGVPVRMTNLKDGYALQLAVKKGLKIAIISGAGSPALRSRFFALGITNVYLKAGLKTAVLQSWMDANGLAPDEVAYVGDDVPDLGAMRMVGLPVAPADADYAAREAARYISPAVGGHGVARDLLQQIMTARGLWANNDIAFG